jgi:hypothetical protein
MRSTCRFADGQNGAPSLFSSNRKAKRYIPGHCCLGSTRWLRKPRAVSDSMHHDHVVPDQNGFSMLNALEKISAEFLCGADIQNGKRLWKRPNSRRYRDWQCGKKSVKQTSEIPAPSVVVLQQHRMGRRRERRKMSVISISNVNYDYLTPYCSYLVGSN